MKKNGAIEVLLPNVKVSLYLVAIVFHSISSFLVKVDEFSQTSVPSIWAVGDVTDRVNLTPVALMEGGALAKTLQLNEPTKPDYRYDIDIIFKVCLVAWNSTSTIVRNVPHLKCPLLTAGLRGQDTSHRGCLVP